MIKFNNCFCILFLYLISYKRHLSKQFKTLLQMNTSSFNDRGKSKLPNEYFKVSKNKTPYSFLNPLNQNGKSHF